jgi:hypothetical protein
MKMPSREWFERMASVDDSEMSVGGLASRVSDLESSAPAASVNSLGILDSSPPASGAAGTGWLTGDERLAVSGAILILDQHGPTNIGRTLNDILARSSPPEVVIPFVDPALARIVYGRDSEWLAALAAAGVKVKEVVK